ncbi:MAG TPA: adenylate/guanylate cyclase domain-containing protein [Ginsengibacter sp.]
MQQNRQLAAILFTDIVGSTAMMQKDEQTAVAINKHYVDVLKETVSTHKGEVLNDYGDGSLCIFSSVTEALRCAMEMQHKLQTEPEVPLRVGLHVGEIFFEHGKVFGDGVNVASRVQSLGIANSILFSSEVCSKIRNQQEFKSVSIGRFHFKNVDEPMEVFALTNEGLVVPDKTKIEGKLKEKRSNRKIIIPLSILLLLGIASFFIYHSYLKNPQFTGQDKSIAVLPFETISSDSGNQYINDGFTIDIIDKLSNLSDLSLVPGWALVKNFKDPKQNIIDIANALGVEAILTGTIQKQGANLHIVAELTDVNTRKTIWNMDDDRQWGDVLKLQNEVAEKIATSLSTHLTQKDKNDIKKLYTNNPEAYNYYIKGRFFWDSRTPVSFDSAEANYKKAIELDPGYALAYAGLADLFIFNQKGLLQREAIPIARDYASKALALDSTLVEAITTIGFIQSAYDYDWKESKLTLKKALALNPNYTYAHIYYGNLLQYTGENVKKGIEEIKKARALDPSSVSINWVLGRNYYFAGKYDSAEQQLRKAINIGAEFTLLKSTLALTLLAEKKFNEAINIIKEIPEKGFITNYEYQDPLLAYAYGISGNTAQGKAELDKALKQNSFNGHYQIARAYIGLNEKDSALSELNKAYEAKEIFMYFIKVDPTFSPLQNEPDFIALLKKMNL